MPKRTAALDLNVDLEGGVVPISKAASALAALFKRARERYQPIIVTQKGYPSAVLLDIELYIALRAHAQQGAAGEAGPEDTQVELLDISAPAVQDVVDEPAPTKGRRGRRRTGKG